MYKVASAWLAGSVHNMVSGSLHCMTLLPLASDTITQVYNTKLKM